MRLVVLLATALPALWASSPSKRDVTKQEGKKQHRKQDGEESSGSSSRSLACMTPASTALSTSQGASSLATALMPMKGEELRVVDAHGTHLLAPSTIAIMNAATDDGSRAGNSTVRCKYLYYGDAVPASFHYGGQEYAVPVVDGVAKHRADTLHVELHFYRDSSVVAKRKSLSFRSKQTRHSSIPQWTSGIVKAEWRPRTLAPVAQKRSSSSSAAGKPSSSASNASDSTMKESAPASTPRPIAMVLVINYHHQQSSPRLSDDGMEMKDDEKPEQDEKKSEQSLFEPSPRKRGAVVSKPHRPRKPSPSSPSTASTPSSASTPSTTKAPEGPATSSAGKGKGRKPRPLSMPSLPSSSAPSTLKETLKEQLVQRLPSPQWPRIGVAVVDPLDGALAPRVWQSAPKHGLYTSYLNERKWGQQRDRTQVVQTQKALVADRPDLTPLGSVYHLLPMPRSHLDYDDHDNASTKAGRSHDSPLAMLSVDGEFFVTSSSCDVDVHMHLGFEPHSQKVTSVKVLKVVRNDLSPPVMRVFYYVDKGADVASASLSSSSSSTSLQRQETAAMNNAVRNTLSAIRPSAPQQPSLLRESGVQKQPRKESAASKQPVTQLPAKKEEASSSSSSSSSSPSASSSSESDRKRRHRHHKKKKNHGKHRRHRHRKHH